MKTDPDKALLKRYFLGHCDSEEIKYVEDFIQEGRGNALVDEVLKELLLDPQMKYENWSKQEIEANWKQFERAIGADEESVQERPKKKYRRMVIWLSGIAAACLLIFCFVGVEDGWTLLKGGDKTMSYQSEIGVPLSRYMLPDGSMMWLTAGSSVSLGTGFGDDNREVVLQNGEAYFDVKKNERLAFVVHSKHMTTRVLGTAFLVSDQSHLDEASVQVTRGRVEVESGGNIFENLTVGKVVTYNKASQKADSAHYEKMLFDPEMRSLFIDDVSFEELAFRVKQVYGYDLRSHSQKVMSGRFTLELDFDKGIKDIMENLSWVYNCNYQLQGKEVWMK
ncbi:FecR family protein [Sphingobacterium faecale]|uniref:FecR domain-containing protein n=1 Tax=Sphingobacterium faecale TaxID=2803775 RepID=A0ABS1QZ09_9SPHI|nr:FecR family protein [Sphingobacterium faecale]MBL1407663.1 FecR domain-containing protein [Sphingobacterium faecale]